MDPRLDSDTRAARPTRAVLAMAVIGMVLVPGTTTPLGAPNAPAAGSPDGTALATPAHSSYLELRIYRSKPNQRDNFLQHFETYYLESQEADGMRIWGQFRDLDTPEHFVWMRGYPDHDARPHSLTKFYTGKVWQQTSPALEQMFESSAHVHYLEPLSPGDAFDDDLGRTEAVHDVGIIVAQLFSHEGDPSTVIRQVKNKLVPGYRKHGAVTLGMFASSEKPDNFPILPYITDEPVVAWIGSFPDRAAFDSAKSKASRAPAPHETFVLEPGKRSRLYHRVGVGAPAMSSFHEPS